MRLYRMKIPGISARKLNHWANMGVGIDGCRRDNMWSQFRAEDLVWYATVLELRKFGVPLTSLAQIRDKVVKVIYEISFDRLRTFDTFLILDITNGKPKVQILTGFSPPSGSVVTINLKERAELVASVYEISRFGSE